MVGAAACVAMAQTTDLMLDLKTGYRLGSDKLPAPQSQVPAGVIEGILGGDVPREKYLAGAGLGALLSFRGIGGLEIRVGPGFYER